MSTNDYLELVKQECVEPILNAYDVSREELEVIQVWYCKTIQNHKGLFIVKNKTTNFIYQYFVEATYNGDNNELYLDFYEKQFKHTVNCDNVNL